MPVETGRLREAWLQQLETAAKSAETVYDFLCKGLAKGVKPQQTHTLFRRADPKQRGLLGRRGRGRLGSSSGLEGSLKLLVLCSHEEVQHALLVQAFRGLQAHAFKF